MVELRRLLICCLIALLYLGLFLLLGNMFNSRKMEDKSSCTSVTAVAECSSVSRLGRSRLTMVLGSVLWSVDGRLVGDRALRVVEDDPRWDCLTMGNRRCG